MGKYVIFSYMTNTTTSTTNNDYRVYSTHCLNGYHDYGYSDKCDCFCHRGADPFVYATAA